ncbi:MAG TPA: hypothetical protein VJ304_14040, partial [Flavobacterium sp.]|nr:hypothetical protein [Flavobacterium sp.]
KNILATTEKNFAFKIWPLLALNDCESNPSIELNGRYSTAPFQVYPATPAFHSSKLQTLYRHKYNVGKPKLNQKHLYPLTTLLWLMEHFYHQRVFPTQF